MSAILNFNQQLTTITCYKCGIVFAVPQFFRQNREEDKESFYCPSGHSQAFVGTAMMRLEKQLEEQKRSTEWQRLRADRAEKSLTAQKAQTTKLKNRIARGVCPCCHRSFAALGRHMKSKHPDYVEWVDR